MKQEYVLIDLFSGIGGFALGFRKAGVKFAYHYFSEIEKNAIGIYKKHFPEAKELGDVTAIRDFSELKRTNKGRVVIVTFGFPCQDLSIAGKGRGLEGSRSGLFFEAMRIIRELQPRYFIFENVKGLFTNNQGQDFERCLREIADIGLYDCEWQLVNTSWFLPQNRERIYFIGHLRGESQPKVFPIGKSSRGNINQPKIDVVGSTKKREDSIGSRHRVYSTDGLMSCLTATDYKQPKQIAVKNIVEVTKNNSQGARVNTIHGDSVCLSAHGDGQGAKTGLYVVPRGNNQGGYRETDSSPTITSNSFEYNNFISPVLTPSREKKRQNGRRLKNKGEPSFTLTTQDQHGIFDGHLIRKLTPTECERLQGFQDGWTEYGADGKRISDSARYKCLGNAVSVPIPEEIGRRLGLVA